MMTAEQFARWRGVEDRFIALAVRAMSGERMPRSAIDGEPHFAALVREWHEYRASEPQDAAP